MNISPNQNNRGHARAVVAIEISSKEVIRFSSVRGCAMYFERNPAAVTKVCQGAWNTCNQHKLYYEDDYNDLEL